MFQNPIHIAEIRNIIIHFSTSKEIIHDQIILHGYSGDSQSRSPTMVKPKSVKMFEIFSYI